MKVALSPASSARRSSWGEARVQFAQGLQQTAGRRMGACACARSTFQ